MELNDNLSSPDRKIRAVPRPRPKCGHGPGHEAGECVPTLDSYWASHLNEWLDMQ